MKTSCYSSIIMNTSTWWTADLQQTTTQQKSQISRIRSRPSEAATRATNNSDLLVGRWLFVADKQLRASLREQTFSAQNFLRFSTSLAETPRLRPTKKVLVISIHLDTFRIV